MVHTVCLYAKNRFEKFARIFSRRHKQTTFSDAGHLRVNSVSYLFQNLNNSIFTICYCLKKLLDECQTM